MTKERGGSLIFLAAGIYGLVFSIQLPFGKWNEPGPGVFPLALSILLCVSGIGWFIHGKGKAEEKGNVDWGGLIRKLGTPLKIVGLTLAYIVAFDRVGYLLASLIYIFILFLWVSRYKLWIAAGLAILIGAGSWLFFERLLSVQLPKGLLPL
jgi:putative tricarboxylic transport membrane protein